MDDEKALLRATVRKLHAERRTMHEMLTEAGVREDVLADGVRTCLIGRLGVALAHFPIIRPADGSRCFPGCPHTLDEPNCSRAKPEAP